MKKNYLPFTTYSIKQFSAILILVFIFFSPSILSAQGKTIEINIVDKQYQPPAMTLKIPQEFKDKGARFVVRAGDVIKICNADKFFAKPTSLSMENKFQGIEGPGGLRPGSCITVKAQNPGNKPISFWLHDNIHLKSRLFLVVLPANWPDEGEENTPPEEGGDKTSSNGNTPDISGTWKLGNDWIYIITQNGPTFSWDMAYKKEKGEGKLTGNSISASWSGPNGSGSASGTVERDANGNATRIHWNNGAVFTRN